MIEDVLQEPRSICCMRPLDQALKPSVELVDAQRSVR